MATRERGGNNVITEQTPEQQAHYLLKLVMDDIERRLVKQAIDYIKPQIMATAREAVKALEPKIQTYIDLRSEQLLVQVTLKEVK